MPGLDGWEIAARVHQTDSTCPVIILTGLAEIDDREASGRPGVAGLLLKPCSTEDLVRVIASVTTPGPAMGHYEITRHQPKAGRHLSMNVLVTGGMGNLGSRLAARLVERGDRVTVLDLRPRPLEDSPALHRCRLLTADIADLAALQPVLEGGSFDSIFHLAAMLSSDSEQDSERAWRVNLEGTRHILQAAAAHDIARVIFASSTASFGPGLPPLVGVDSPQWPASLYGATKVAGERLGVYFHHRFGLDFRGLRIPAVVAPRGAGGGATAFCSEIFAHAVHHGRYEFYVEPHAARPLIYIDDAVRALLDLHDAPEDNLTRRVYQLAGTPATAREMAAAVLERLPGVTFSYRPEPVRNAIVLSLPLHFDDSHAARDWNWAQRYNLGAMTERMLHELQEDAP